MKITLITLPTIISYNTKYFIGILFFHIAFETMKRKNVYEYVRGKARSRLPSVS